MKFVGKPSEKVGRKAMGLQIVNLDRQAAPVYLVCLAFFLRQNNGRCGDIEAAVGAHRLAIHKENWRIEMIYAT